MVMEKEMKEVDDKNNRLRLAKLKSEHTKYRFDEEKKLTSSFLSCQPGGSRSRNMLITHAELQPLEGG